MTSLSYETLCLTKGDIWKYEEEWRMIVATADCDDERLDDLGRPLYLYSYPPSAVSSIILGPRISQAHRIDIVNLVAGSHQFKHVSVYQAELDKDTYSISFRRIPLFSADDLQEFLIVNLGEWESDDMDDISECLMELGDFGIDTLEQLTLYLNAIDDTIEDYLANILKSLSDDTSVPEDIQEWSRSPYPLTRVGVVRLILSLMFRDEWDTYRMDKTTTIRERAELGNRQLEDVFDFDSIREPMLNALAAVGLTKERMEELERAYNTDPASIVAFIASFIPDK